MRSSGSLMNWDGLTEVFVEPLREPARCKKCGVALEWHGTWNGIVGWHPAAESMNSVVSDLCNKCYAVSLMKD